MAEEVFYSLQQVADLLHVNPRTVTKLITDRKLSALVLGRQWRISQTNLNQYMERFTVKAST